MKYTGILYIEYYYPGFISLTKKKWFHFEYKGKPVAIVVDRHVEAEKTINFKNSGKQIEPLDISYNVGPLKTKRKIFLDYSRGVIKSSVFHTVFIIAQESKVEEKQHVDEGLYIEIINFFIKIYRSTVHDIYIQLPSEFYSELSFTRRGFYEYSEEDFKVDLPERLFVAREIKFGLGICKFANMNESVPMISEDKIRDVTGFFEKRLSYFSIKNINDIDDILVRVKREFTVFENYKFALLESFIIIELETVKFLRNIMLNTGVSKGKLDEYETEVPISYKINIEIPSLVPNMDKKDQEMIGRINRIRRLRNDVVHRSYNISKEESLEAVKVLHDFLDFIARHSKSIGIVSS